MSPLQKYWGELPLRHCRPCVHFSKWATVGRQASRERAKCSRTLKLPTTLTLLGRFPQAMERRNLNCR